MTAIAMSLAPARSTGVAWAEEVEEAEARNGGTLGDFPTLGESVQKQKQQPQLQAKKSKKGVKLTLNDFNQVVQPSKPIGPVGRSRQEVDIRDLLPTAPRERTGDEAGAGGIRDYSARSGGFGRRDDRDDRRENQPSIADEVDDWGANRKFQPSQGRPSGFGYGRDREREPRTRDGEAESGPSEADLVDNWGSTKKYEPAPSRPAGGARPYEERRGYEERRSGGGGFKSYNDRTAKDEEIDWGKKAFVPAERGEFRDRDRGYGADRPSEADQEDRWSRKQAPASEAPADRPSERPRLNLKPRTVPVDATAKPAEQTAAAAAPRKSNPFGEARPREEVLEDKGINWRKQELKYEHEEGLRDETVEEKAMKEEIENLKIKLDGLREIEAGESDTLQELEKDLHEREYQLYDLTKKLDDDVREAQRREREERRVSAHSGGRYDRARSDGSANSMHTRDRDLSRERGVSPAQNGHRGGEHVHEDRHGSQNEQDTHADAGANAGEQQGYAEEEEERQA